MLKRRDVVKLLIAAPAVVHIENIMPIWIPPAPKILIHQGNLIEVQENHFNIGDLLMIQNKCNQQILEVIGMTPNLLKVKRNFMMSTDVKADGNEGELTKIGHTYTA